MTQQHLHLLLLLLLYHYGNSYTNPNNTNTNNSNKIPITILSGFLGSGKTTLLQHLLKNKQQLKIAVIVNDVASVNVDGKLLVRQQQEQNILNDSNDKVDVVELENGCACCSLADELLASVAEVVTLSDLRAMAMTNDGDDGDDDDGDNESSKMNNAGAFDHIVIELSGVAEPRAIRANFQEAVAYQMPLMDRTLLDTMVTVIDCSTFLNHLKSGRSTSPKDAPELFYRNEAERLNAEKEDVASNIMSLLSPKVNNDTGSGSSVVSELLVDQTEVADIILLNKIDQVNSQTLSEIEAIIRALNPTATILRTEYGQVNDLDAILGAYKGLGAADSGIVDDHKDAVQAAKVSKVNSDDHSKAHDDSSLDHNHEHINSCADPTCTDSTHDHSHQQEHSHSPHEESCTNPTHDHNHQHEHSLSPNEESCTDLKCTDPTHDHSHQHEHSHSHTRDGMAKDIGTYVYSARRPFHPQRLSALARYLPVEHGIISHDDLSKDQVSDSIKKTFGNILRSKGFTWLANSNVAAYYWAHAGASFEIQVSWLNWI